MALLVSKETCSEPRFHQAKLIFAWGLGKRITLVVSSFDSKSKRAATMRYAISFMYCFFKFFFSFLFLTGSGVFQFIPGFLFWKRWSKNIRAIGEVEALITQNNHLSRYLLSFLSEQMHFGLIHRVMRNIVFKIRDRISSQCSNSFLRQW